MNDLRSRFVSWRQDPIFVRLFYFFLIEVAQFVAVVVAVHYVPPADLRWVALGFVVVNLVTVVTWVATTVWMVSRDRKREAKRRLDRALNGNWGWRRNGID